MTAAEYDRAMSTHDRHAAAELWRAYGEHAVRIFARGPAPTVQLGPSSFFVSSGGPHVDLNQAALFDGAGREEAVEIGRLAEAADIPVLLAVVSGASNDSAASLASADFKRLNTPEHLFWMPGVPIAEGARPFEVRRMTTRRDMDGMLGIFADVHEYEPELTAAMYEWSDPLDHSVSCWIAWDGDDAVSLAFITHAGTSLGLWEVMTPPRHRRRGGARSAIVAGLNEVARTVGGVERTLFWSSPLGQPLYEALGFRVGDNIEVWVRDASDADLAAVGAG